MSTDLLRLIPEDPALVPAAGAIAAARALLRTYLPEAELVTSLVSDEIRFVDPGSSFESVSCPSCLAELDPEWWQWAMESAFDREFADLSLTTPCCGAPTNLNALHYRGPAGFARFSIEVAEPGVGRALSSEEMDELEKILETPLRQIRARY
jgi:hypothetical protein